MAPKRNPKETSAKVASQAARVMNDPKATKAEKSAAASALAQTKPKSRPKGKQ